MNFIMKQYYEINNEKTEKKSIKNIYNKKLKDKSLAKIVQKEKKKFNINNINNINKIRKSNSTIHKNLLILFIISLMNYSFILCKFLLKYSEVTLKINGKGKTKILSDSFFQSYNQCEIHINNDIQNIPTNEYDFSNIENNIIKIIWNIDITSTESMFLNCSQISEIDLSYFNSTKVTSMQSMFYGCSSLTSLNLYNFVTSHVIYMNELFYDCYSLSSLSLSSFDSSNVIDMASMFFNCSH